MKTVTTYHTKQREIIESYINSFDGNHFTVDSLCAELLKNGETVGRTTVYRCLEKLCGDSTLRKYHKGLGESACYQYIDGEHCSEHFHLKCECCGSLIHIECDELNLISAHIKEHHNFNINPLKTVFYGVCESCAKE